MKTKYFLGAALCVCAVFSSCSDDVLEEQKNIPWQEGDGIQFGARAGFENNDKESRTIYTGEFYKVGNTKFEKISWIPGEDYISILSPEAKVSGGGVFADYQVTERHSGTNSQDGTIENSHYDYATLVPATQGKALQWGAPEKHQFYACYPTYATTTIEGNAGYGIKIYKKNKKVQVSGTIPNNQIPNRLDYVKGDENHPYTGYVARPVMRNAHMVAYGTHDKSNPDPVNLTFKSIVTALEIDLVGVNEAGTNIIGALIGTTDPNQQLVGQYQCEINKNLETGYPKCKNVTSDVTSNQILIPLLFSEQPVYGDASGGKQDFNGPKGVILKKGNHLKFTAFILPTDDDAATGLKNITLTLISMTGRQQHEIPIPQEQFKAHLKHYVNNVKIPTQFDSRNWMSRLDDDVYLSQLSIPGTGDSYSWKTTKNYSQTQTLDIEKQWNMGVRCFEITSDRSLVNLGSVTHLGQVPISSSNIITDRTEVQDVIKNINTLVTSVKNSAGKPTECAFIIMNYQPDGQDRNVYQYIDDFINYVNNKRHGVPNIVKYNPNLTLGEVRGKLMFILRPSSDGEDKIDIKKYDNENNKFLIANGWGSLQDKWKQRGYPIGDTNKEDNYNGNCATLDWEGSIEKGIILYNQKSAPTTDKFSFKEKGTSNFEYDTNSNFNVWAQEWNRVIPCEYPITDQTNLTDPNLKETVHVLPFTNSISKNDYVAWKESYNEKLQDAKDTFEKAITDKNNSYLYFNCLTGYFINTTDEETYKPARESYYGSKKGDVTSFAKVINKNFFEYMWNQWNNRITGPMGIVLMNRVGSGNEVENPENFYMPNIVISNNFSFPLKTKVTQ